MTPAQRELPEWPESDAVGRVSQRELVAFYESRLREAVEALEKLGQDRCQEILTDQSAPFTDCDCYSCIARRAFFRIGPLPPEETK